MPLSRIRNFSIIAHIDHGKSTLADRILQMTQTVAERDMRAQLLDSMDLERERGITIKAQAVRVMFRAADERTYELNLIDTPGHVDFSYEVSRSLAACEGALLVVDAAQGIEAQTLANAYLAIEGNLEIVPVVNKIDLPSADPDGVAAEVAGLVGGSPDDVLRISAKTGAGIEQVLQAIVDHIPAPSGEAGAPPRALIFDSTYDQYRGVVAFVRMVDGSFHPGDRVRAMAATTTFDVEELGFFSPGMRPAKHLAAGEVGYIITGLKDVSQLRVGDTLTHARQGATEALPGYLEVKPMVFAGLFPTDSDEYPELRDALEKLKLNDAALSYEPESSRALGFGFPVRLSGAAAHGHRAGAAGARIRARSAGDRTQRRLPGAGGRRQLGGGAQPGPDAAMPTFWLPRSRTCGRPRSRPKEHVGTVMELNQERRGEYHHMAYLSEERVQLVYDIPLAEIVLDYYDKLKSRTRGYASFDYDLLGFREGKVVKVDVLLAGERVDSLSLITHRDNAQRQGRVLVETLRERIPRQMFDVAIQAAIGSRVIARETVKAKRKDVTAKCYGGDISRKRKLLEKQKKGKRRMKQVGSVEVPQEAFLAVLEINRESA